MIKNRIIILVSILFVICVYFVPSLIIKNDHTFISDEIHTFNMLDMPKPIMEPMNIVLIRDAEMANNLYIDNVNEPYVRIPLDKSKFYNELDSLQDHKLITETFKTNVKIKGNVMSEMTSDGSVYAYDVKDNGRIYKMYQISTQNKFINLSIPKGDKDYTEEKKKVLLQHYVEYLGLDYIKDWTYDNNQYFSSKVYGVVSIKEEHDMITLKLNTQYHQS